MSNHLNFLYGLQRYYKFLDNPSAFAPFSMNSTTTIMKWGFTADEDATITKLGFRYTSRTGTPPTYRISLREFSGATVGTVLGEASPVSATFTPPADATWNGTWREVTLDNPYTCYKGEPLMIVIDYSSGIIDASNFSQFTYGQNATGFSNLQCFPHFNSSATTGLGTLIYPIFSYSSSSKTYGYPLLNIGSIVHSASISRIGVKFNIPTGVFSTFKVSGIIVQFDVIDASGDAFKIGVYDSSSTLQSQTFYSDVKGSATTRGVYKYIFSDSNQATLNTGTDYYLAAEYFSGTYMSIPVYTFNSSENRLAISKSDLQSATYASSTWTADNTKLPLIYPIITDLA